MKNILSVAFLTLGIILVVLGIGAADSISSSFSRLFTGAPTDKTLWLIIGGVVAFAIGLVGLVRGPNTR